MAKLSADAIAQYEEHGYYAPLRAVSAAEATALRAALEDHEAEFGPIRGRSRTKTHLLFTWLDRLIRNPAILDAVESVIGPNILVWGSGFFIKEAHDRSFVSWHQDSTYWGLDPADIVTAWVAFSESTTENGAMRVIPGTHRMSQLAHVDTFAPENLLSRGQEVAVDVDPALAVTLELQPGEFSLHHVLLVHGSEPNPSPKRRIGYAIRYIPTYVRQVVGNTDSATLVRGVDSYGHFATDPAPDADYSEAAQANHARITAAAEGILFSGAKM